MSGLPIYIRKLVYVSGGVHQDRVLLLPQWRPATGDPLPCPHPGNCGIHGSTADEKTPWPTGWNNDYRHGTLQFHLPRYRLQFT